MCIRDRDGSNALNEGEFTLVQTEYGYHVIKCVTVNDEEAGQTAKENSSAGVSKSSPFWALAKTSSALAFCWEMCIRDRYRGIGSDRDTW